MGRIRDLPEFQRPREKIIEQGVAALKDHELLAILLRTGYKGKSAVQVADQLLKEFGLQQLDQMELKELAKIKGIGLVRAATIKAALGLASRLKSADELVIRSTKDVATCLHWLATKRQEHFVAIYLNARNQVLQVETISVGTLTQSLVHPREVFAPALELRAAQVIVAHNHPSGILEPSEEDLLVTERLVDAGEILGIEVIDHVILSKQGFWSLKEVQG